MKIKKIFLVFLIASLFGFKAQAAVPADFGAVEPVINAGVSTVVIPGSATYGKPVVQIPGGTYTTPYLANQANTVYRLMGDIHARNTGIAITTNGITIDLNGYTIYYDEVAGNSSANGISFQGWTHSNIGIYNGSIIQGGNGTSVGQASNEYGTNANLIVGGSVTNIEVAGIYGQYKAADATGIYLYGSGVKIHDNTIEDNGTVVTNRHQGVAAIKSVASSPGVGAEIYRNKIINARQSGVRTGSKSIIRDNDIIIRSRSTNSAGIEIHDDAAPVANLTKVYNNKIKGTGEHPLGIYISGGVFSVDCYGNYTETENTKTSSEYENAGSAGYRIIWGNNHNVHDNTFIVKAGTPLTDNTSLKSWGRTIWASSSTASHVDTFQNNLIIALNSDGISKAAGVAINWNNETTNLKFVKNKIVSNWSNILLADSYGEAGGYAHFIDNEIIKADNNANYHTFRSELSYYKSTAILVNNTYSNGASLDVSAMELNGDGKKDLRVAWNVKVVVQDASGSPISNATVTLKNVNNEQVFSGTTDGNGIVNAELEEKALTNIGLSGVNNHQLNTLGKNPYSLNVQTQAAGLEAMGSVTADSNKTIVAIAGSGINLSPKYSIDDFIKINTNWMKSNLASDVNNDSIVNSKDLGIVMSNWQ